MSGSFMRRFMMWALAHEDSSDWVSLAGCMILRYARHKPSMDARESWLEGKPLHSWGAGKGRKLESLIVCIAGMMVVWVQGVDHSCVVDSEIPMAHALYVGVSSHASQHSHTLNQSIYLASL